MIKLCTSIVGTWFSCGMFILASAQPLKNISGDIVPFITSFEGVQVKEKYELALQDGKHINVGSSEWSLSISEQKVAENPHAKDYKLTWKVETGSASDICVGVDFPFSNWSADNYVFVPAIVYDGNRFDIKDIGYPPFWYDKAEWRKDMPTTMTKQPTLGKKGTGMGKIELTTGNTSTPLMAFYDPKQQKAWMVQTTQGNQNGNHGLSVIENETKTECVFSIVSPSMRSGSSDQPSDYQKGDSVSIQFRVYTYPAKSINDLYQQFLHVRKDLNKSERKEVLPFSEMWNLINNLYQTERWDETIDMYWLSKVGANTSWNFIWQLGWCGGGQNTLPIMMKGGALEKERAKKNIDVIISKSQAKSGFFNAYGNGNEFVSFGYGKPLDNDATLVRSQGDWLYMAIRQFNYLESQGESIPLKWLQSIRKLADAFVSLWNKEGQFGQFVNVETGEICIGNSTAGAIVCGGLALASQLYKDKSYLEVAQKAGRKYYKDYVLKGYTTGGPGEILSTPDSESAFGLFEAYMALYEVTSNKEWLEYASQLLPICASWTVSYDYDFPVNSEMGKIDAHSCGAVWASVANKHGAPGICTWSGDCLLKYYRATGDKYALDLLVDISHGLPQYVSRKDRQIGNMPPGGSCERVNLSDWEGKSGVGGNIFASCSWVEAAIALTVVEIPSIYIQPDKDLLVTFDNICAEKIRADKNSCTLSVFNPTDFPAEITILCETSKSAKKILPKFFGKETKKVLLKPGEKQIVTVESM